MAKCPDCDSIKILSFGEVGDGRCSGCHGTGEGGIMDAFVHMIGGQKPECEVCHGSTVCQTCNGTGEVD